MKKFFAIAALLLAGTTMASAQYVTKAFNDVTGKYDKFDWANAHNFVPIAVSTGVAEAMESVTEQGIKFDLRINEETTHDWFWDGTYEPIKDGGEGGENSFGENEDHFAVRVTGILNWSGQGFVSDIPLDLSFLDDNYYVHFAIKGDPDKIHAIGFGSAKMSVGNGQFEDQGVLFPNVGTYENDDEWYYFDIPYSVMKQIATSAPINKDDVWESAEGGPKGYKSNYFWTLSGGVAGTELHLDNVFFYTKGLVEDKPEPTGDHCDTNGDGEVSVADVTWLIDHLLTNGTHKSE
ncbi:MAG: hypothetical protein II786_02790 [Muribaculaceae bacterium]|nr:hypothetical protein [Muribaculaceae bacterium]MBR3101210.1 hypothetical protein [Muribaculaceae bacterium]